MPQIQALTFLFSRSYAISVHMYVLHVTSRLILISLCVCMLILYSLLFALLQTFTMLLALVIITSRSATVHLAFYRYTWHLLLLARIIFISLKCITFVVAVLVVAAFSDDKITTKVGYVNRQASGPEGKKTDDKAWWGEVQWHNMRQIQSWKVKTVVCLYMLFLVNKVAKFYLLLVFYN